MFTSVGKALQVSKGVVAPIVSTNIKLLLHMEGAGAGQLFRDELNHTFTDNGTSTKVFTDTAQAKFGSTSARFTAANTSYISTPNTVDFAFGTGDFIVDCWIRPSTAGASYDIIGNSHAADGNITWTLGMNAGVIRFFGWQTTWITGATQIAANVWTHVLVSRVGNTIYLFINGVSDGSANVSTMNLSEAASSGLYIGWDHNAYFDGYIDEMRVVKGQGVSAPFSVATAPYNDVDPFLSQVQFLLDTSGASPTDVSLNAFTLNVGSDVSISNTQQKFAGQSVAAFALVTAANSFIKTTTLSNNLNVGGSDFTWEAWWYPTSDLTAAGQNTLMKFDNVATGGDTTANYYNPQLMINGGAMYLRVSQTGSAGAPNVNTGTFGMTANSGWYHIEVDKVGTNFYVYVNGILRLTGTGSGVLSQAKVVGFGEVNTAGPRGYVYGNRVTVGQARHSGGSVGTQLFVPPTQPMPKP